MGFLKMQKIDLNVKTNEITYKDFSKEEILIFKADQKKAEEIAKLELEKQALKESANAKLLALGLSPEEVAAITGN
jgi:hypothetical protein